MVSKIRENRLAMLFLLTGAVYFFLRVIAPLSAPRGGGAGGFGPFCWVLTKAPPPDKKAKGMGRGGG